MKMQLWAKERVEYARILAPTRKDLNYLKQFIDETAELCNKRIGERLAQLLSTIHTQVPSLLIPQAKANRIASAFRMPLQVGKVVGVVPPD